MFAAPPAEAEGIISEAVGAELALGSLDVLLVDWVGASDAVAVCVGASDALGSVGVAVVLGVAVVDGVIAVDVAVGALVAVPGVLALAVLDAVPDEFVVPSMSLASPVPSFDEQASSDEADHVANSSVPSRRTRLDVGEGAIETGGEIMIAVGGPPLDAGRGPFQAQTCSTKSIPSPV